MAVLSPSYRRGLAMSGTFVRGVLVGILLVGGLGVLAGWYLTNGINDGWQKTPSSFTPAPTIMPTTTIPTGSRTTPSTPVSDPPITTITVPPIG